MVHSDIKLLRDKAETLRVFIFNMVSTGTSYIPSSSQHPSVSVWSKAKEAVIQIQVRVVNKLHEASKWKWQNVFRTSRDREWRTNDGTTTRANNAGTKCCLNSPVHQPMPNLITKISSSKSYISFKESMLRSKSRFVLRASKARESQFHSYNAILFTQSHPTTIRVALLWMSQNVMSTKVTAFLENEWCVIVRFSCHARLVLVMTKNMKNCY
jgi:hypothetical protein